MTKLKNNVDTRTIVELLAQYETHMLDKRWINIREHITKALSLTSLFNDVGIDIRGTIADNITHLQESLETMTKTCSDTRIWCIQQALISLDTVILIDTNYKNVDSINVNKLIEINNDIISYRKTLPKGHSDVNYSLTRVMKNLDEAILWLSNVPDDK